ncbi:unnamed protein product [Cuscuta europaea]|uniref:DUF4283 domain-containing protein n=1 Tax=Cuscuta europaea TaxID=41803 RepID=A0A9P0Z440_CUSEU|nr:unnamed protein product [Cuscuta europaea]
MGRTKQVAGEASNSRYTRSKYAALQDLEEDFPVLNSEKKAGEFAVKSGRSKAVVPNKTCQIESEKQETMAETGAVINQTPGANGNAETSLDIPNPGNIGTDANAGHIKAAGRALAEVKAPSPAVTAAGKSAYSTAVAPVAVNASQENVRPAAESLGAFRTSSKQPTASEVMRIGNVGGVDIVQPEMMQPARPWSSLFKDNRDPSNGLKLRYIPPKGNSLDFIDRNLPSMVEMWGFFLVGHFTGKHPGLKAIYALKNSWGVRCIVKSHQKGWVIFKFHNDEDRDKVLKGGTLYHLWDSTYAKNTIRRFFV